MRILPIRTISGRIVLGFLVLLCTFAALGAYVTVEMRALSRDLKFIRQANLDIVVLAARLHSLQSGILNELDEEQPRRPALRNNRLQRQRLLDDIARQLDEVTEIPTRHVALIARMRDEEERIRQEFAKTQPHYDRYFVTADKEALVTIKNGENQLASLVRRWFSTLRNVAAQTTERLEDAERRARFGTIVLGAVAAFVALLVTLWSVLTLRPIRRLRDGARRVAAGEYKERVDVVGETEVAEVAREFNAMAAAIEEREQELVRQARLAAVGKMAAIITHEIRNPLSSIGLNAELLQDELDGQGEAGALCRKISKEVDRLAAITEEYLRFARLPRPRLAPAELNEIVTDLVQFQREELGMAGVQVSAELEKDLPAVAADEGQLRQALLNLVRNAADAMSGQGGGTLKVATRRSAEEDTVEVAIADSGPGISGDLLPRIFEPFFSTKEQGTGLGLALTQQIVVEHGGRLEVDSAPGKGTTFVVKLPAARAA